MVVEVFGVICIDMLKEFFYLYRLLDIESSVLCSIYILFGYFYFVYLNVLKVL